MAAPYNTTTSQTNTLYDGFSTVFLQQLRDNLFVELFAEEQTSLFPTRHLDVHIYNDIAGNTSALDEVSDPTGKEVGANTVITIDVEELGDFTVITRRLEESTVDAVLRTSIVERMGRAMAVTLEDKAIAALAASTNAYGIVNGQIQSGVTGTSGFEVDAFVDLTATLKKNNVAPNSATGNYTLVVDPYVEAQIKKSDAWQDPHNTVDTANVYNGIVGSLYGFDIMSSNRVGNVQAGVYTSYVLGDEGLAKYFNSAPELIIDGAIVDPLNRKVAVGYRADVGYKILRDKAVMKITSTLSDPNS